MTLFCSGMLLLLQAGPWIKRLSTWENATEAWFRSKFSHPIFQHCLQHKKVEVIWLGYATSQTPALEDKYPYQSVDHILEFNAFTRNYVQMQSNAMGFPLVILDWLNLTYTSQTSDGFHGLTEVNLVKASHILNVMQWLVLKKQQIR
jgi:hypothetical protein